MTNRFHQANRRRWDAGSASWADHADMRGIWRKAHRDPSLALHAAELAWLRDVAGKKMAVLGSGDNQVVFALAGMGAAVTSVDISEQQIEVARSRAAALGLQVDFVQADVVELPVLGDATFDTVYTGGHVAVWVADLRRYYGEAARIQKPEGLLIVNEYHPFRRIWRHSVGRLEVRFNYFDRGPHRSKGGPDVLYREPGQLEQFTFRWTVADYIKSEPYEPNSLRIRTGNFLRPCREFNLAIREVSARIRESRSRPLFGPQSDPPERSRTLPRRQRGTPPDARRDQRSQYAEVDRPSARRHHPRLLAGRRGSPASRSQQSNRGASERSECAELVGAQADRRRCQVLLEMRYRGGPGNWQHGGGTLQQPGQRDLARRGDVALGDPREW